MAAVLESTGAQPGAPELDPSLLDQIVEQSRVATSSSEHVRARDLISELVSQVMQGTMVMSSASRVSRMCVIMRWRATCLVRA